MYRLLSKDSKIWKTSSSVDVQQRSRLPVWWCGRVKFSFSLSVYLWDEIKRILAFLMLFHMCLISSWTCWWCKVLLFYLSKRDIGFDEFTKWCSWIVELAEHRMAGPLGKANRASGAPLAYDGIACTTSPWSSIRQGRHGKQRTRWRLDGRRAVRRSWATLSQKTRTVFHRRWKLPRALWRSWMRWWRSSESIPILGRPFWISGISNLKISKKWPALIAVSGQAFKSKLQLESILMNIGLPNLMLRTL